ncbi:hypothetical protein SAMN05443637_107186 [Pseudonocardia thermophila]|jgi:hypothetical protein|uniref:Uncharacterized protein n=1 Tax=Pseudonocardia thermophila TaxID=1848 RepID=A0A1M6T6R7_PSETH|nr:hypothetical protein [Pseudonocardia thermophila]SHK52586.1 hypothetical protein SAMN05443637_107186 [Pseudonocardia thermophila]
MRRLLSAFAAVGGDGRAGAEAPVATTELVGSSAEGVITKNPYGLQASGLPGTAGLRAVVGASTISGVPA